MVSTGGPVSRSASERSPPSSAPLILSVRVRVSGLYWRMIMPLGRTVNEFGSSSTRLPLRIFGEPWECAAHNKYLPASMALLFLFVLRRDIELNFDAGAEFPLRGIRARRQFDRESLREFRLQLKLECGFNVQLQLVLHGGVEVQCGVVNERSVQILDLATQQVLSKRLFKDAKLALQLLKYAIDANMDRKALFREYSALYFVFQLDLGVHTRLVSGFRLQRQEARYFEPPLVLRCRCGRFIRLGWPRSRLAIPG